LAQNKTKAEDGAGHGEKLFLFTRGKIKVVKYIALIGINSLARRLAAIMKQT
jgi:hypothetical protein